MNTLLTNESEYLESRNVLLRPKQPTKSFKSSFGDPDISSATHLLRNTALGLKFKVNIKKVFGKYSNIFYALLGRFRSKKAVKEG
jgi:hypothetical protein